MTSYDLKSQVITNRDATPMVLTDAFLKGGNAKEASASITTNGSADAADSIYRMVPVPSHARVSKVTLQSDALGSACALDVGVYWPTFIPVGAGLSAANQSVVIGTAFFASAVACSAALVLTEVTNESTTNTIAKQQQPLWQALGLATDPGIDLDVCIHVQAAVAAAGDIGLKVSYVE
jgi:hypothetical protein